MARFPLMSASTDWRYPPGGGNVKFRLVDSSKPLPNAILIPYRNFTPCACCALPARYRSLDAGAVSRAIGRETAEPSNMLGTPVAKTAPIDLEQSNGNFFCARAARDFA
jgi:hypothetical protein